MSGPVPVAGSLADIYQAAALPTQAPRWNDLLACFDKTYGRRADFIARSPGRVNIIGEHIDYSLYSVLPMAITADAILAVSSSSDSASDSNSFRVRIANLQGEKFPAGDFSVAVDGSPEIDSTRFDWINYFKSGLAGALELLRKKKGPAFRPRDMDIVMDGTVPVGGGLSSSAAFVSASALAVMYANGEAVVDKKELTELAIVSERAVGVNSGGMDQSASVLSEQGAALFVSFSPSLSARPIQFPATTPELCFVVAQSFVTSNKQVTGPIHYNLRVVECSFAAAYLNAVLNPPGTQLPADAGPLGISLHGFHDAYFYHQARQQGSDYSAAKGLASSEEEIEKLLALAKETLTQEEGYTREEVAKVLGVSVADLEARFMSKLPVRAERFKLRQRAVHVFTEALRVLRFMALLERPESHGDGLSEKLGALMDETQASCRDLYECSCPEIDQICAVARAAGAYGSRLTGAGWGGCSVHLVPVDKVAAVKEALEREYYAKLDLTAEQREEAVVVSRPARGSAVYVVKDGIS
jgi:galactokinase